MTCISSPDPLGYEEVVSTPRPRYPGKQPRLVSAISKLVTFYLPVPLTASNADPDDEMFIEAP